VDSLVRGSESALPGELGEVEGVGQDRRAANGALQLTPWLQAAHAFVAVAANQMP